MLRFLSIPHEPLARFRLLSVWFAAAFAFMHVGLFAVDSSLAQPLRWGAAVAAALLGAWWLYGYRRGGFPIAGWLVDTVLMVLVATESPMPARAIGLFYAGIQFRALYVPRRELALLPLSYAIARVASIAMGPSDQSLTALSALSFVQILGLTVIAVTLHLFVEATQRQAVIEQALKRSDERYQLLAGAMRDVVYDWNVATGTIEWTESMRTVFGIAPESVGTTLAWWVDRVHPDDRATLERGVAATLADPAVALETVQYRVRRADDSYAYVSGSMIVQRTASGVAERVVGSIRDVTTEQQLEERLRQSQKMEAVGQLAGGVAHDFNNMLTVVGGHVYMLEHYLPATPLTTKHLGGITQAAERAASLTKQLLAFGRKQLLTPTLLNLNTVVGDVLAMMQPVLGEHVQIVTQRDPVLSPVFADSGQLVQVLVNLVLNARDAMSGGGTLTIETRNTTIQPWPGDVTAAPLPPGDYARLTIRDTGAGMDAQTLARAFEPFFTTKPYGQGTGLGLSTAYGIVKQSGGDIQATSVLGAGSTFTILLPVAERPADQSSPHLPTADAHAALTSRQLRVLLVEDDESLRAFALQVLSHAGCRVRAASNGVDALDKVRAQIASIDVVVTDVVMPEMGGRELVKQLHLRRPDLPVLYITGYTDDLQMLTELRATNGRLLEKPFTASALELAVNELVEATEASGA